MRCFFLVIYILFFSSSSSSVLSKTLEPILEDPFDLASGGAVLTRATQEGMLVSNPAQLIYGDRYFRWLGFKTTISVNKESTQMARNIIKGQVGKSSEGSDLKKSQTPSEIVNSYSGKPVHLGLTQTISFITSKMAIASFVSADPDLSIWLRGDPKESTGFPSMVIRSDVSAGSYVSFANKTNWKNLSYGLTAKYILIRESKKIIQILDAQEEVKSFRKMLLQSEGSAYETVANFDLGLLYFRQRRNIDWRFALTVKNIGGKNFAKKNSASETPQFINTGASLTWHSRYNALHLAIDLRDLKKTFKHDLYRRVFMGAKLVLWQYIGLATGIYHGSPTYGAEFDLLLFRLSLASYMREYEETPNLESRRIYMLSLSTGFEF